MTTPTDDDDFLFSGGIDDDDFLLAAEQAVRTQISPPPKLITSATPGYFPDSDDDEYGSDIDISELTPPQPDEIPDLEEEHELFHNATVEEDDPATPDDALPFPGSYNSSQDIHPADHDVIDLTSSPVVPPELSSSQALSHWDALGSGVKISPKRPAPKNGSPTKRKKIAQEPLRPKSLSRPPLPAIVLENSLVDGLTPKRNIRSCFCIASAIQLAERGDAGVKNDGLIELYARVSFSSCTPPKQYFQFMDLQHDEPPYLNGSSEVYKRCELWQEDAGNFLNPETKGKIAKVVGRMRKARVGEGSTPWHLEVLGIQEITWWDVCDLKVAVTGRSDEGVSA